MRKRIEVPTNAQCLEQWLQWSKRSNLSDNTANGYAGTLRHFFTLFGLAHQSPSRITENVVYDFVNASDGTKKSSRNYRLAALKRYLKFATTHRYAEINVADLVEVQHRRLSHAQMEPKVREVFTGDEIAAMENIEDDFWSLAVPLALHTGLRLSDVASLDRDSFNVPNCITVWTSKSGSRVHMPIPAELYARVKQLPGVSNFLFPEKRKLSLDPERRATLSAQFGRLINRLGIRGKSFHCLRHTFATRCRVTDGESIEQIRQRLGHSNIETTKIYIHESNSTNGCASG